MTIKTLFTSLVLSFFTAPFAYAYDAQISGQIDLIEGASTTGATSIAGGFSFLVTLKNSPALCGNANTSAYLLNTDANFRVNASILLTAKSLGSTVVLSSNRDSNGYCQIMAFTIQ